MKKKIVIALGGNTIKQQNETGTVQEQYQNIKSACEQIIKIIKAGYQVVLTHGNGPQIGNILIQQEAGASQIPVQSMSVCGAMSQGQIGYLFEQALANVMAVNDLHLNTVALITQSIVDKEGPAFTDPTKPVGPFYDLETKERYEAERGYIIKKVLPNGVKPYRRVVPCPDPLRILEGESIKILVDAGVLVVASGGGGVPVIQLSPNEIKGVAAVIDKDLAGQKLAEAVNADILMILTDVEMVTLDFGTPKERGLDRMTLKKARQYLEEGQFLLGSMAPKVKACIRFIENGGQEAIITSLHQAFPSLKGCGGTHII